VIMKIQRFRSNPVKNFIFFLIFSQFFISISCKCCQPPQESNGKGVEGQRVLLFGVLYPPETERRLHCCYGSHFEEVVQNLLAKLLLDMIATLVPDVENMHA